MLLRNKRTGKTLKAIIEKFQSPIINGLSVLRSTLFHGQKNSQLQLNFRPEKRNGSTCNVKGIFLNV